METLEKFIQRYLALSLARNTDIVNPIKFNLVDPEDDTREFVLVASGAEPSFAQIPYNTLWLVSDEQSQHYSKLFVRLSSLSSDDFKGTWTQITDYADIFNEDQYYAATSQDLRDHGIISLSNFVGAASTTHFGLGYLTSGKGVAVTTEDPRNTDARYPVEHTHSDYARSMLHLNDNQHVRLDTSIAPSLDKMLFLTQTNSDNALEFGAVWRHPVFSDLVAIDRKLVGLEIVGVSELLEQTSTQFQVIAHYADGNSKQVEPTSFLSSDSSKALATGLGLVSALNTTSETSVNLVATYDEDGIFVTDEHDVTILLGLEVTGLRIQGSLNVNEETSSSYSVIASFSDGTEKAVTPSTTGVSPQELGTFNVQGLFTANDVIDGNKTATLSASYTYDGVKVDATRSVQVIDTTPYPVTLEVLGPVRVTERQTASYATRLTFSDGNVYDLPLDSFTQSTDSYSTFDGQTLEVNQLDDNQSVILTAAFSQFSTSVSGSLTVQLDNLPPSVSRIDILSPSQVHADRSGNADMPDFVLQYLYDDASTSQVLISDANSNEGLDIQLEPSELWSTGSLSLDSTNTDKELTLNLTGLDSISDTSTYADTQTSPSDFVILAPRPNALRAWQSISTGRNLQPNSGSSYWALFDIVYHNNNGARHSFELDENFSESDYLPSEFDPETADWASLLGTDTFGFFIIPPTDPLDTRVERADYNVATGGGSTRLYPGVKFFLGFDDTDQDLGQAFSLTWKMLFVRLSYSAQGESIYTYVINEETFNYEP